MGKVGVFVRNISFAVCSILISCLILFNLRAALRLRMDEIKTFTELVMTNLLASVSSVVYELLIYVTDGHVNVLAAHICNLVHIFTHMITVPYLMLYMVSLATTRSVPSKGLRHAVNIPAGIYILLLLTNGFTGLIFRIDENGMYQRGSIIFIGYMITLYFIILLVIYQYHNRERLNYTVRFTVLYTLLFSVIAAMIQFFWPREIVETCVISLCLMILFFKVQNPMFMMHPVSGAFNRQALSRSIVNRRCTALAVLLPDISLVEHTFGGNSSDLVMAEIMRYLKHECATPCIYCTADDSFCVLLDEGADCKAIAKRIIQRFAAPWFIGESETLLAVKVCCVECPDDSGTVEDFDNILAFIRRDKSTPKLTFAKDLDFDRVRRDQLIEAALTKVSAENSIELQFFPVYSKADQCVTALRLFAYFQDETLGVVGQDEFMLCAERCGMAAELDRQIFDKMCDYISRSDLGRHGIRHVIKEILPFAYMEKGAADRILSAVRSKGVDIDMIRAVVRESGIAAASEDFLENLQTLDQNGLKLYLADYGAGYSDVSVIFDIPFTMIFINQAVVAAAAVKEKATAMMQSSVSLIRQMGMKVGAAGADSQNLFALTLDMGCDYITGDAVHSPLCEIQKSRTEIGGE